MSEHREPPTEYIEPNARFVGNGVVCDGVESWAEACKDFSHTYHLKSALLRKLEITSFSHLSFVATYEIDMKFDGDDAATTNEGTMSVMMSQHKKISHIVEATTRPSLERIQERYRRRLRDRPVSMSAPTKDT